MLTEQTGVSALIDLDQIDHLSRMSTQVPMKELKDLLKWREPWTRKRLKKGRTGGIERKENVVEQQVHKEEESLGKD